MQMMLYVLIVELLPGESIVHALCEALQFFDNNGHLCISECTAIDTRHPAWKQAHFSLSRGDYGNISLDYNIQHCNVQ